MLARISDCQVVQAPPQHATIISVRTLREVTLVTLGSESDGKTFLERHWPLVVGVLALAVLCFSYFAIYSTRASSARALLLAVVPDVASSLIIAACLYLLLNRDFRKIRTTESQGDLREALELQISSLKAVIDALYDHSGVLRRRSVAPTFESMFEGATTISIAAVSGLGIVNRYRGLLEEQLRLGRKLRILLLDIEHRDALQTWDRLSNPPMNTPEEDIRAGIRQFLGLADLREYSGSCEVKLLDTVLPYSLIMCEKPSIGTIQVEVHSYRRAPEDRPNILLSSQTDPHWFQFFSQQFETAWRNARMPAR